MSIRRFIIKGEKHNSANSLAAAVVGLVCGVYEKNLSKECLSDFKGVEHRPRKIT